MQLLEAPGLGHDRTISLRIQEKERKSQEIVRWIEPKTSR